MSLAELKKQVGNKKLIAGTSRAIKELKKGNVKIIFLSSNCPKEIKSELEINAKMEKAEVSSLGINSEELGVIIKKPFSVSVVSLLK
jgi:large subunit ribosomal protein L30e